MPLNYPSPITIAPSRPVTASVIFLHGLGDQGHGWAQIAEEFQAGKLGHVRFIFPNAPRIPITLNGGMSMPGWYDIASLEGIDQGEDEEGLKESMRYVEQLVAKEVALGVPSTRVVVGGFSQGGAVAMLMLRSKTKLAAVAGLSTYLPLSKAKELVSPQNLNTPVFMGHGDADRVVAYQFGLATQSRLASLGVDVDFATYQGMQHSACPTEMRDLQEFLAKHLPAL